MKYFRSFFICILLFSVLYVSVCPALFSNQPQGIQALYNEIPLFTDALTLIRKYYVREVTPKDLIYGALKGMMQSLDPFSEFLPPKKYEEIKTDTQGEFGGVGLVVAIRDDMVTVVSPMEGTPAEKAGVKGGDVIIEVDGKSTKSMTFSDTVDSMRGKSGTEVVITVLRGEKKEIHTITIERAIIEVSNVKDAMLLTDGVGYVRIVDFGDKTESMLRKELSQLEADGATALILDLRNNPGGLLNSAVAVAEMFLAKDDLIVYTCNREGKEELRFTARGKRVMSFSPLIVLVNKGSASGSEVVAGAIKDNKRGTIVGKQTFGKASVQTIVPLRDGSALRLTTAEYYTPSGISIHGKGIVPDAEVSYANDILDALVKEDTQSEEDREAYMHDAEKRKELLLADAQIKCALALMKENEAWDGHENE